MVCRLMLLAVLAMALEACADCTQDPSQAGFFCGIKNIAEGTYEHRQTALRSETEGTEAVARQRSDELRTLQSQETSLAVEKNELQKKLASLQADIDKQKRLLANASLHQRADRDTLMELEARLKVLQEKRMRLGQSDNTSLQEVEDLKRDTLRLQNQIADVLTFTAVE
jgi:chromosome segregation ATPase